MIRLSLLIFGLVAACALSSCSSNNNRELEPTRAVQALMDEDFYTNIHKQLAEREKSDIEAFIKRSPHKYEYSNTGLYYSIYQKNPSGASLEKGNMVEVEYTIQLLNGTPLQKNGETHTKKWVIGSDDIPIGIYELISKMKRGEKAYAVLPSHLAYKFAGDGDLIPEQATLLYDLEIKAVYINTKK